MNASTKYFVNRLLWYTATLFVAITLNFMLPRLGPVDPVDIILAGINTSGMTPEDVTAMQNEYRQAFNLDIPLIQQYFVYLKNTFTGDLGISAINYPKSTWSIISEALPWTLLLVIPSIVLGWIIGNVLGALAAYKRGLFDKAFYPIALFVSSVPFFCFGLILVYVFYTEFNFIDSLGAYSPYLTPTWSWNFALDVAHHFVLPFFSIFLIIVGGQAIGMRSMSIYELGTDYVKYAKTLGIKEWKILMYVFRNAMLPQLTGLALAVGVMIGGSLITELIFSYPGLGNLMLKAIQKNDYPLIQGISLLITLTVLALNFSVDVLLGFLDPRIRAGQKGGS
jgi:peptide/nickel transport system permease protein